MNKKKVDSYIPIAVKALKECGIADKNGNIEKTFRGQISSFGAATAMGSFKSAVAFFSCKGESDVDRDKLIKAIWYILNNGELKEPAEICEVILSTDSEKIYKDKFIDASIALKLAMNAYHLTETK